MLNVKNAKQYIEKFLKIKTKNNEIVPFTLNEPQKRLYDVIRQQARQKKPIRLIILKARQMGFSTLTEALIFHRTATKANVNSLIIAHKDDATTNLFNMSKLFYSELPPMMKPQRRASNAKEIIFDAPSRREAETVSDDLIRSQMCIYRSSHFGQATKWKRLTVFYSPFPLQPEQWLLSKVRQTDLTSSKGCGILP